MRPSDRRRTLSLVMASVLGVCLVVFLPNSWMMLRASVATFRNEPSALVLDSTCHDFGFIQAGQEYEARFAIANVGGRRLILHRDDSGCPCLSSNSELRLLPGTSGELVATLKTSQFQSDIQTTVRYRTNDPQHPIVDLTLIARVAP